jgi:NAD(P)-dependent dehydrogenase (short-subunit alcohol dehydrogenase family)
MSFSLEQFQLNGKVAIITGAGGRGNSIGRAYAMGLAAAGAAVVVADLNLEGALAVAEEIQAAGGKADTGGYHRPCFSQSHGNTRRRNFRWSGYSGE